MPFKNVFTGIYGYVHVWLCMTVFMVMYCFVAFCMLCFAMYDYVWQCLALYSWCMPLYNYFTPFAVHYEKMRHHLRETGTNSAKIHSLARKYEHLPINQIQLCFLHFNQHSITLLGIHMGHWAYKREKYTFINANIKVINTILKVNRDNWHTLKCKHYSLTFIYSLIFIYFTCYVI